MTQALVEMAGAYRDPGMPATLPSPTARPPGMLIPGNINLAGRPIRLNPDGTVSSELSYSFGDEKGREILVPTVVNGKFLTPTGEIPPLGHRDVSGKYIPTPEEEAMQKMARQHYEDTGEHMGIFSNPDAADAYARQAHLRPMNLTPPVYMYHPFDNPGFAKYIQSIRNRLGMGGE